MKKLPEYLFVAWQDASDESWLSANAVASDAIEGDGPTVVGTYKLVEKNKLSKRVVSKTV